MSEGGRFVSPMTRESLPPDLAPADEQREVAATFRRERSAAMLAFAEEAAGLDGRQEMAMSVVDRVAEYRAHLPYTSPISPPYLPYISPTPPLYLPGTSRPCPPRRWCLSQAPP